VVASVIIPVRNRERTIGDAVRSALAQQTSFDFNVIVVDNLSSDGTGDVLAEFDDVRLVVQRPDRADLGIGGCWNLAIESDACGRYAVQLDSDDLFSGEDVLSRVIESIEGERWAMLVGSYTTVDFSLTAVPPGLVDHREWSAENGHNNLLRVNGLGAPRVYDVALVRATGFPNVSYGEDYAVGLAISRDFAIGRIHESLYWCRRWEGNTDSSPTVDQRNRFNAYKDWLRSGEIAVRRGRNRKAE
jgi:glycosyltransferase involved in cell wall biosynthesis